MTWCANVSVRCQEHDGPKKINKRAAIITAQTSSEIALSLYEEIITQHGCVHTLITDNGKPMFSQLVNTACRQFGIHHKTISPYHSQSPG